MSDRDDAPVHDPSTPAAVPAPRESAPPDGERAKPSKRRKPRWGRRLAIAAGVLLVLVLLLVALAPTLLSTAPGTSLAQSIGSNFVNGRVQLSGLSVGWFSETRLDSAIVEDQEGRRVVQVANLNSGLTLWDAIRGNYELGDTSLRLNLTTVTVDDQGVTNLHEVFGIDPNSEEETQIPNLSGTIQLDGDATVQYVGKPDSELPEGQSTDNSDPVHIDFTGTRLVFGAGQALEHQLPLALRVGPKPAGTVTANGTIDLDSLTNEMPTLQESVRVEDLNLAAVATLLSAFGLQDYDLAGTISATFEADTTANTLAADLTADRLAIVPRATEANVEPPAEPQGYHTERLTLALNGGFEFVPNESDTAGAAKRPVIAVEQLRVATAENETVTLAGRFDPLRPEPMNNWPQLASNVVLDVQTDYATAHGEGASLAALTLTFNGDAAAIKQRFGALLGLGDINPQGTLNGQIRTQQATSPTGPVAVTFETAAQGIRLEAPEKEPLQMQNVALTGRAVLTQAAEGSAPGISEATASLQAEHAQGQPILVANFSAADLQAESGSAGRLALDVVRLPDYQLLRETLAGWVDLPEATGPVPVIEATAVAQWDGETKRLSVVEPLRALVDGQELAVVTATATQADEMTWTIADLRAEVRLPAAQPLLAAFSAEPDSAIRATGIATLVLPEAQLVMGEEQTDLSGLATLILEEVSTQGVTVAGELPVRMEGMIFTIPADTPPLRANGGTVRLAGTALDLAAQQLSTPDGALVTDVNLNPVLMEALGQYINPLFVDAEQATGLLDVQLTQAGNLNLADPLGPEGGSLGVSFSIRELRIDNDIVGAFAEQAVSQIADAAGARIGNIPGLRQQLLGQLNVSEEVKEEISSIRGNILNAVVTLENGVAGSRVTFNIADPRQSASAAGAADVYPLTFTGDVNLESLSANLSVTIPRSLIEKWAGENPDDLVEIFGEQPFARLIPEGVTIGVDGTTHIPRPDVSDVVQNVVPRAIDAALKGGVQNRLQNELNRRLGDLLNR